MKNREPFRLEDLQGESFFYIVHLFDRVLVGEVVRDRDNRAFEQLRAARERDLIVEAHFFNQEWEIYMTRDANGLLSYPKLLHRDAISDAKGSDVIERVYPIALPFSSSGYRNLIVREYVEYEDDLAVVGQTILYALEK